jgi:hypothetical protein
MDYTLHYQRLIDRSPRQKPKEGYFERHHIVPKCLGGTNEKTNLVFLTPEEHYVAHQLLVKMHPKQRRLIYAVHRMAHNGASNRKFYGWLRRTVAQETSRRMKGVPKTLIHRQNLSRGKTGTKCIISDDVRHERSERMRRLRAQHKEEKLGLSEKHRNSISRSLMGNTRSKGKLLGTPQTEEQIRKRVLATAETKLRRKLERGN